MHRIESAVTAAEELLAQRFGGSPELTHPEDLGGNGPAQVVRARIAPNPFMQERSIVIKQLPPRRGGAGTDSSSTREADAMAVEDITLVREIVSYQFTNTLPEHGRPGPLLLAYDIERRMIILSDAGDGDSFTDILTIQPAAQRHTAVRKLGRALGQMHTATTGREDSYFTLLRRQCQKLQLSAEDIQSRDIDVSDMIQTGVQLLAENNIPVEPIVLNYAKAACERQHRAELRAFTPFDLTPDNLMLTNRVVVLDFEWAGFRDIAFDVACVIAGFPQDVSTPALTDAETSEFLSAWRAEVVDAWPALRDDQLVEEAIMTSLIGWSLFSLTLLYYGRLSVASIDQLEQDALHINSEQIRDFAQAHLEDLATTVEAILRFSRRLDTQEFTAVRTFALALLGSLHDLGASPRLQVED